MQREQIIFDELEKLAQNKDSSMKELYRFNRINEKLKVQWCKNIIEKLEKEKAKLKGELLSTKSEQD